VVPNAFSAVGKGTKQHEGFRFLQRTSGLIYLLVFTRYYPQKNLEILPEVAKLIKEKGLPYRIIFTLEPEQHPGARQLLELINASDLGDIIINLGNIPFNEVEVLYQEVDALLLPTVLESFSTTYADAMFYRKPIITSNLDFALEVCRDAAWYFEPKDPHSILAAIEDAFCNPAKLQEKIELAHQYSLAMPDWEQVTKSYMGVLEELSVFPAV
jgi:glycosyltransferase involved in cell wall biosynthesis